MTNKEIKLELAKAALQGGYDIPNLANPLDKLNILYEWVNEKEENDSTEYDDTDIRVLLDTINRNGYCIGAGARLEKIFRAKEINTLGDLLRINRYEFSKYEGLGKKTFWTIVEALEELGIKEWK